MSSEIDVLFPPRIIPQLKDLRGDAWRDLVTDILQQAPAAPQRLAFVMLMIRLGGCHNCHADTYRAMRGCLACATQTIKRYRGGDQELLRQFVETQSEIERYLKKLEVK
jgi:hypothetical protein